MSELTPAPWVLGKMRTLVPKVSKLVIRISNAQLLNKANLYGNPRLERQMATCGRNRVRVSQAPDTALSPREQFRRHQTDLDCLDRTSDFQGQILVGPKPTDTKPSIGQCAIRYTAD